MSNIEINPLVPIESVYPTIHSSNKHILSKRLVEIRPTSNVAFSYAGNNQIEFNISSLSDFLSFAESYIRMDVTCTLNNGGVNATSKYLSEGGVHSLFRTLEVYTATGTLIQRVDRYNKLYAAMSTGKHSAEYVDSVLWRALDSTKAVSDEALVQDQLTVVLAEVAYDHTGGAAEQLLTLAASAADARAESELQVGDLLRIETAVLNYTCRVLTIESDSTVTVEGLPAADITASAVTNIQKIKAPRKIQPMRQVGANTASIVACWQPMVPLFQMSEWMPLFLLNGGIRIVMTLENPAFSLVCPQEPSGVGYAAENVSIANPVFMASMIQPDDNLHQDFKDKFMGNGISIPFHAIDHYLDIQSGGGSGTFVSQINANVRSARYILSKIQNARAETVSGRTGDSGKSTFTCDSIAQGLKAGLSSYLVSSGSDRFPQSKPIDTTSIDNGELQIEFERALEMVGSQQRGRYHPVQWQERSSFVNEYEATEIADSQRLVLASDLSRHATPFSGLDLTLSPIRVELEFDAQYQLTDKDGSSNGVNSDRYFHHWLVSDSLVNISNQGVIVFK